MKNSIYLRRHNKIILAKKDNAELDNVYIATLLKNIESLGFILSEEIINILKTYSIEDIEKFHEEVVRDLRDLVGAHKKYEPMYPNFPQQVMDASEAELHTNAIMHYLGDWFGVRIMPEYKKKKRPKLEDGTSPKVIELGSEDDFNEIFTRLVSAKISISKTDKSDLTWFVEHYKDNIEKLIPKDIPLKENVSFVGAVLIKHTNIAEKFLKNYLKTTTDILRFITALSDGDASLATNTKFINFKREDRRLFLSLLENIKAITEDMLRYKEKWKRVGEKLHPYDYKKQYPKVAESFDIVRNDKPFETFNSQVEKLLFKKDMTSLLDLLINRPGILARRLDNLIRLSVDTDKILSSFSDVADKVSTPVLWQVMTHFKHRNKKPDLRVFFPKSNVGKVQAINYNLPPIDKTVQQEIVNICKNNLIARYKKLEPLGKVYLDKKLKSYTVPFALRSASKTLKTLGRGSKLDLPEGNTIRFFIWWTDGARRTDIDLNAAVLNSDHIFTDTVSYYNLKTQGGYHSGDITSAPEGASEFIDLNVDKFLKNKNRYIVMTINSYTQQLFSNLPECFAGFMVRKNPNSGEIYEPRTVANKIDIASASKICIPLIIDLVKRKVIWTDIALQRNLRNSNNVYNNMSSIALMNKAMTSLVKPSLYELFELHAQARGTQIDKKKKADTIFSVKEGITPFDTEKIIADFI